MRAVAGAVLSGLLLVWALPPAPHPAVAVLALVPLAVAVARVGGSENGPGGGARAWMLGASTGAVAWGILLRWIVPSLDGLHPLPLAVAVWAAVTALLAALTGVAALLLHRLHRHHGLPLLVALPVAWTAVEWLRAHLGPLSFPWLELGASLTERPALLAPAAWSGARGLSFWLVAVTGWIADRMLGGDAGREASAPGLPPAAGDRSRSRLPVRARRALTALAPALLLLPALLGWWRVRTLPLVPGPEVAVVGTDVALRGAGPRERTSAALAAVRGALAVPVSEAATRIDLVVLPEAVVRLQGPEGVAARDALRTLSADLDAPLLVGAYLEGEGPDADVPPANGALLVRPGGVGGRYEKRRLVPGLERVPFLATGAGGSGFRAGTRGDLLEVGPDLRVGVLVCFESLFATLARAYRAAGADVLVALTDDAWLAEGGGAAPGALAQHAAHLSLRAAETGTGVVRSANRGWSGAFDPLGRRIGAGLPPGAAGLLRVRVPVAPGTTPYVEWGDVAGGGSALLSLLVALLAVRRSR